MIPDSKLRELLKNNSLQITPSLNDDQIQPASIDLRLGNEFITFRPALLGPNGIPPLDPAAPPPEDWTDLHRIAFDETFLLQPGQFVLATTFEYISMPTDMVARVEGKSSLGRLGLVVHATAGFIDPNFSGRITLEMTNYNVRPIVLRPRMKICQLSFDRTEGMVLRPYGHPDLKSKYQYQTTVTPSRSYTEKK